jgi:NAD(P)-dependent dehydrogenase (short-subunit alcohol dehydrogenase family)
MRVVVIGGLGNFGARICRRLAQEPGLDIIATSRRVETGAPGSRVAALDIENPNFAAQLQTLAPDLVIHCAGPFQGQDYRVALASLACPAHYLDLADGRDFVSGFVAAVGPAAQAAQRFAITGASTLPALSSAIIDSLSGSFATLRTIFRPSAGSKRRFLELRCDVPPSELSLEFTQRKQPHTQIIPRGFGKVPIGPMYVGARDASGCRQIQDSEGTSHSYPE